MNVRIVKLAFTAPLRVGEPGIGLENTTPIVHSDTLFSALCHAFLLLKGETWLTDFLEQYQKEPLLVLSSAFPYTEDIFYLPKPFYRIQWEEKEPDPKSIKQIRWLSHSTLDEVFSGRAVSLKKVKEENKKVFSCQTPMLTPRVALGRWDMASELFFCGQIFFAEKSGLYILVSYRDALSLQMLKEGFHFLGEEGLGGERNVGLGRFKTEWIDPDEKWMALLSRTGNRYYLAGLFHPKTPPQSLKECAYDLRERRGWFYSPISGQQMKRKTVWMFAEGSILNFKPVGHLVDLSPEKWKQHGGHPIYRCGVPFVFSFS